MLDKSRDKLFTENFIQNYIIQYSNVLILVFGILSLSEQKLLIRIKKVYKEILTKQPEKKLIIIHNLQTYETKEEVDTYIKETLLKSASFKVKKTKQNFVNEDIDFLHDVEDNSIYHLIYAREGSIAGEFYNNSTINAIKTMNIMNTNAGKYDYKQTLKDHFKNMSKRFLEFKADEEFELYEERNEKKNEILKCKKIINGKESITEENKEIRLKRFIIDELGTSIFRNNCFEPKIDYYITEQNELKINIECPGETEVNAEIVNDFHYIEITGNRKKFFPEECKSSGIERENEDLSLLIPTD